MPPPCMAGPTAHCCATMGTTSLRQDGVETLVWVPDDRGAATPPGDAGQDSDNPGPGGGLVMVVVAITGASGRVSTLKERCCWSFAKAEPSSGCG